LGKLELTFDAKGELKFMEDKDKRNPILLDKSVKQDEMMLKKLEEWKEKHPNPNLGKATIYLNGFLKVCGVQECGMGNVIADAMVAAVERLDTRIALINAGKISDSIGAGNINLALVLAALGAQPHTFNLIKMKGVTLRKVFEHAVYNYRENKKANETFLQMSGIQVVYDVSKKKGSRVQSIHIKCHACDRSSNYRDRIPLDDNRIYNLAVIDYIGDGGHGYSVFTKEAISNTKPSDSLLVDVVVKYIKHESPIANGGHDGRICFVTDKECRHGGGARISGSRIYFFLAIYHIFRLFS